MAERPGEGVEMLETPSGDGDGVSSGEDESGRSSSSDSEPDEEAENIQIDALEKAVQENPANYEAHVQVCHHHTEIPRHLTNPRPKLLPYLHMSESSVYLSVCYKG